MIGLGDLATALQNIAQQFGRLVTQTSLSIVVPVVQGGTGQTAAGAVAANAIGALAEANNLSDLANPATALTNLGVVSGSWTPILAFGGASVGITYGTQVGFYRKIGGLLIAADFNVVLTSKGSSTGAATLSGLPFPSSSMNTSGNVLSAYILTGLTGNPVAALAGVSSVMTLVQFGAANYAAVADTNFTNTSAISGVMVYFP